MLAKHQSFVSPSFSHAQLYSNIFNGNATKLIDSSHALNEVLRVDQSLIFLTLHHSADPSHVAVAVCAK